MITQLLVIGTFRAQRHDDGLESMKIKQNALRYRIDL